MGTLVLCDAVAVNEKFTKKSSSVAMLSEGWPRWLAGRCRRYDLTHGKDTFVAKASDYLNTREVIAGPK